MILLSFLISASVVMFEGQVQAQEPSRAPAPFQSALRVPEWSETDFPIVPSGLPGNLSAQDFFACDQTRVDTGFVNATVAGKSYSKLYQIKLNSSCTPKENMGLYRDLPLNVVGDGKFSYMALLNQVLGLKPDDIKSSAIYYQGPTDPSGARTVQPFGTRYQASVKKSDCDANGNCKYPIQINSTVDIQTDGKSQITVSNNSDSIVPLDNGIVSGHLKTLNYNFTISRDVGGYRIRFESITLMDRGNFIEQKVFNGHRIQITNGSASQFEKTKYSAIEHLLEIYYAAYPKEVQTMAPTR